MTPMSEYLEARERVAESLRQQRSLQRNQFGKHPTVASVSIDDICILLAGPPVSREDVARVIDPEAFGDMSLQKLVLMADRQKRAGQKADAVLALYQGAPK